MSHDYNTRTKKQEDENNTSITKVNLETKLLDGFSILKVEAINFKDMIIKINLQREMQSRGAELSFLKRN